MHRTFETLFFNKQVAYAVAQNIEGLINQYHEHATIVYLDTIIHGRDQVHDFLHLHRDCLYGFSIDTIERYTEANNIITVQGIISSFSGTLRAQCVCILHQGKVLYQVVMLHT